MSDPKDQAHAPGRAEVLNLDQAMIHTAILESLQLCQSALQVRSSTPSESSRIFHQIGLRLAYVLAHNPPPRLDPADLRALARFHQDFLARRLQHSADPSTIRSALRAQTA